MKIVAQRQENRTFFVSGVDKEEGHDKSLQDKNVNGRKQKSVQATGCLRKDCVEEKKEFARKQARRLVSDVFDQAQKVDEDLRKRRERIVVLQEESGEAKCKIRDLNEQKSALLEEYGIEEDSQEYQDLLLLEKREASRRSPGMTILTPDERKRLAEIDKEGTTQLQEKYLNLDRAMTPYQDILTKNQLEIKEHLGAIFDTKQAILKDQSMQKATKGAENMMAAASKEAAMMYLEQGKEYLDEKARETKETSKKQKEKKEEQEERIEAIQEKTEQMEGVIESTREKVHEEMEELVDTGEQTDIMVETEQIREDIQAELQKMLAKLGLSEEDLKGVEIDKFL